MRKLFLFIMIFIGIGVNAQVLTIGGEVLKHNNYVLRKNYVTIGGNAWVEKAPKLAETDIYSLCVYNNKLYGGTYSNGKIYEWNGTNAWVEKAPKLGAEVYIHSLCVFNGKLYGGTRPNGKLYEWNAILKP